MSGLTRTPAPARVSVWSVVGLLVLLELGSGVLQGYYTPIYTDIARHLDIKDADVNWFEAAQLIVSAILVPPLARLGDQIGHKQVLVGATIVTALGTWAQVFAPSFGTFLVAWAITGAYVVWLPLEIAIVHLRANGDEELTRRGAALLVAVLETSVIVGAGISGAIVDSVPMTVVLAVPAVVITGVLFGIWRWLPATAPRGGGGFDWSGLSLLTLLLVLVMGGLVVVRVQGPGSVTAWLLVALGLLATVPFARVELRSPAPLVDIRLLRSPAQLPIQLTAALSGMSVLGAQIPLSTFARTDPDTVGYGLGADAGFVSVLIVVYVFAMVVGALLYPRLARRTSARSAMIASALLVAVGYAMWLPWHHSTEQALLNMIVAGVGSGSLVAAIPAAAVAAAPADSAGMATGLTNAIKTVGGAVASAIFAIALSATGSIADPKRGHAPLSGYLTVWAVCSAAALVAAVVLFLTRRVESGLRPR
ncbi:MFS transporter [Nocardioides sp. Iso805N]|uniref:MFS transporter n=1 Tax=Nocardioides sp. Iso805N TaxID=1283287 RepID=UPI00037FD037|nr:MFS transporter [Nocardioides sp. Iso805N]